MKLRYTLRAATELKEVLFFIDERSPQGARSVKKPNSGDDGSPLSASDKAKPRSMYVPFQDSYSVPYFGHTLCKYI